MYYTLYIIAGFTDMIDGTVARKTNTVSSFGSKLDTAADTIFVLVCLVKLIPVLDIAFGVYVWIAIISFIKAINVVWGYVAAKRFMAVHSVMNKVTGILLFLLPLTFSWIDLKYSAAVVCVVATFAAIQEGYYIWRESDAESLYEYAKDPAVGPIAGWPVHTSVNNSLEIIRTVLSADETYAVCLKEENRAIGSIGLIPPAQSHTAASDSEIEIGYWIGVPFWGNGYIPEAVKALQRHAFEDLGCTAMWCGYYDGNEKSKRCQEKCGFKYHHTEENKPCALMGDVRTEHFTHLMKEEWLETGK